ncbi:MAG: hypothetical protein U0894_09940 [Pirellulales bacterium]
MREARGTGALTLSALERRPHGLNVCLRLLGEFVEDFVGSQVHGAMGDSGSSQRTAWDFVRA